MAVPARARHFISLDDERDLDAALAFAHARALPVLALGGGSNIVLRTDYPGVVIHLNWRGREVVRQSQEHIWLKVAAGENWHQLVEVCLQQQYWGLENLSLIPGSVGAAPIKNLGAYGGELGAVFAGMGAGEPRAHLAQSSGGRELAPAGGVLFTATILGTGKSITDSRQCRCGPY